MGVLHGLGGLLANNQGRLASYAALAQQQQWTGATTTGTTISFLPNQYNQSYTFSDEKNSLVAKAPAKPRERTNLDWLDERINEMRVKL